MLYLEEGEHYIQDFYGHIKYYDFIYKAYRDTEAKLHLCSRSLILEFPK